MDATSSSSVAALVSSLPDLQAFLTSIPPSGTCTLCLDLEGRNLGRDGTLLLMTVLVHPSRATYIVDVQTLGDDAFTTPCDNGTTLKAILEEAYVPKYLWDVRNDADVLWSHHHVRLAGVIDVQLLENASRFGDKTYLHGLDRSVERDLGLDFMEVQRWAKVKRDMKALMSTDIFAHRPLDEKTMEYCANDVVYLPALHDLYNKRITNEWLEKAMDESARRVVEACGPAYEPRSEKKKFGPWGSGLSNNVSMEEDWIELGDETQVDAVWWGFIRI
jgi:exonuclease 3'-5' domain-containing protein 1